MADKKYIHPMPHQRQAIEKLHSGSILCAGVGTGKSFTSLLYFCTKVCRSVVWRRDDGSVWLGPMTDPKDLYVITTARKRDTKEWEAECERFDLSDINVRVDSWNNINKYVGIHDAFFIFDEQRVVGSGSWVKAFITLTKDNEWILLSATPGDTWMDYIPVFVANGFYKNRTQFLRRHAVYNRYSKYPKVDKWLEVSHLERLRREITVVMTFEKKTEQHWMDIWVDYDPSLYKVVAEERWDPYEEKEIRDITGACYLMRRVVNGDDRRLDALRELLKAHPKSIIFYNYDYELAQLHRLASEDGYAVAEWNGHQHESIPQTESWAYLVQYTAGCEGWNCVETDTVIFFSQSYSYKQMTQAAGRIDRMNTAFTDLYYYVLKSKAPIDIAIGRALKGKRNFNEKLFMKW